MTDGDGAIATTTIAWNYVPPTTGGVTVPFDPLQKGIALSVSAPFTGLGTSDITASWT